jgi:hypothetical protein
VKRDHELKALMVRSCVKQVATDIYTHLLAHDWKIRNQNGENDTGADAVDDLLKAVVLALQVHTGRADLQADYDKEYAAFIDLSNTLAYADRFTNFNQYYAHNLRASRALSIWFLEGADSEKGKQAEDYFANNVWRFTSGHKNGWFAFIRLLMDPADEAAKAEGIYALKSLSLKPTRMWSSPLFGQEQKPGLIESTVCHRAFVVDPHLRKPEDYSTWQKEPWDVGGGSDWDKEGRGDASGLDFLLAYWVGRVAGAL